LTGRTATFRSEDMDTYRHAVWHVENPSLSAVEMPRMALAAAASREVKVVLTGEGADEVFGGYGWFRGEMLLRRIAFLPAWARRVAAETLRRLGVRPGLARLLATRPGVDLEQYRDLVGPSYREDGMRLLSPEARREGEGGAVMDVALPGGFAGWHPFCQLQFFELMVRLPSYIERDLDRTTMAHSVEARVPFLDRDVMALASEIPPRLKQKWTTEKDILRRAMAGVLPAAVARRRKRGLLAPVHAWMRSGVPKSVAEAIAPDELRRTGYFEAATVAAMARDPNRQWAYPRYLFGVAAVQAWHRLFVEGRS
jgi:asparagine synthase (glutamine-hydrolysing)